MQARRDGRRNKREKAVKGRCVKGSLAMKACMKEVTWDLVQME